MSLNKIIAKALSTAQPTTEALLQVINATENPAVATEILLGIYEAPVISPTTLISRDDETNHTFISYNPFTDDVIYSYNMLIKEHGWIYNGLDVIEENIVSKKSDSFYACKELGINETDFRANHTRYLFNSTIEDRLRTNTVALNKWNKG